MFEKFMGRIDDRLKYTNTDIDKFANIGAKYTEWHTQKQSVGRGL